MAVVHYIHYQKNWFYWTDEKEETKYGHYILNEKDTVWFAGEDWTHRMVATRLKEMFPECKVMKATFYHFGERTYGVNWNKKPIRTHKPAIDENGDSVFETKNRSKVTKKIQRGNRNCGKKYGSRPWKVNGQWNRDTIRKSNSFEVPEIK